MVIIDLETTTVKASIMFNINENTSPGTQANFEFIAVDWAGMQYHKPSRRFNEFPIQVRLKIWRYAQPNGRLIQLTCTKLTHIHRCNSVHPNILYINRESREETLRSYTKLQTQTLCLFFNPHRDVFYHYCSRFSWDTFTWPDEILKIMPGASYFPWAQPHPIREPPEQFKIRRLALRDFGVGFLLKQLTVLELDEIVILCGANEVLTGTDVLIVKRARILDFGKEVGVVEGWGDAAVQNRLMSWLEDYGFELERIPVVKLVQMSRKKRSSILVPNKETRSLSLPVIKDSGAEEKKAPQRPCNDRWYLGLKRMLPVLGRTRS